MGPCVRKELDFIMEIKCPRELSEWYLTVQGDGGYKCVTSGRKALPGKFLLLNELFQTELFDSVAYLSERYAQFLSCV